MSKFQGFDENLESFDSWEERLQQYFLVQTVPGNLRVASLITLIGPKTYNTLKTALYPETPAGKTYEELVNILKAKLVPTTSLIIERYKFHNRKQNVDEKVEQYIAVIKHLAKSCRFEEFLDQALRDRLVCGITNVNIQKRLLGESEQLSFNNACQIALSLEIAETQSQLVQGGDTIQKITSERSGVYKFKPCNRCGRRHDVKVCPAVNWECFKCNKKGHTSKVCRSKEKNRGQGLRQLEENGVEEEPLEIGFLGKLSVNKDDPVKLKCKVEGKYTEMEIDSGACKSVMHIDDFKLLNSKSELEPVKFNLRVVTGQPVNIVGQVNVKVEFKSKYYTLPLVVLKSENKFCPLLGRNWLSVLNPEWQSHLSQCSKVSQSTCNEIKVVSNIGQELEKQVKSRFKEVFRTDGRSSIDTFTAEIKLKQNVTPIFHRAYNMAYALQPKVEKELNQLVKDGILEKVTHSEWASPIVVVAKKNSDEIRICVDFKKTVNQLIETDHCMLPLPKDIFATLSKKSYFTVIDLKGAYQQLKIGSASKELLTINTHLGLYRFNRLTYGISSAPGIFQTVMNTILAGTPGTSCYLDDILVSGTTLEECHNNVIEVMSRLNKYNIKVNESKCQFYKTMVEFLGYKIDREGIHPLSDKIDAIVNCPSPENMTQLKSYLGLLNYYGHFIPMLSSKIKPLYDLAKKGVEFAWSKLHEDIFQASKSYLLSNKILIYYDPVLPIYVTCDASPYGVGAILSHKVEGKEKPILFASSTLSKTEVKYSQIEREALAIMFGIKKFHNYIFGRRFTLISDHQPLQYIFGSKKGIPVTSISRLQRWAIKLSGYNYNLEYKKGSLMGNADALSRLPIKGGTNVNENLYSFSIAETVPINYKEIASATTNDVILSKVIELTQKGWPKFVTDTNYKPYWDKKHELSVEQNCLLWGNRVIVPQVMRKLVLSLFHEQHMGIVRTKMLVRSYCWWPSINLEIEELISNCENCQVNQNKNNHGQLLPWPKAANNFQRVHIDFFHKSSFTLLILVDSKSKWIDVKHMSNGTSARETINKLKEIFATFGLPVEVVSDNGPPFNAAEFVKFCQSNGIKPTKSPAYHPSSNGIAERAVQTVKRALEKGLFQDSNGMSESVLLSRLHNFLFSYRNTPSTSTGLCPSEHLFKMKPRTRFDLLKPPFQGSELASPSKHDYRRLSRLYSVNESVYVKQVNPKEQGPNWCLGKIVKVLSPNTYLVMANDHVRFVHSDMIREAMLRQIPNQVVTTNNVNLPRVETISTSLVSDVNKDIADTPSVGTNEEGATRECKITRSGRIIKPVVRLNL